MTVEKIAEYCRVEVSKEIYNLILYGEEAEFPEVAAPPGKNPSTTTLRKFEMEYKRHLERIENFQKEKCKAFGIILGQCRELTKQVVKSDKNYRSLENADNVIGLLGLLRDLSYGTDKKRYVRWIQQAQLRRAVTFAQNPTETLQQFASNFNEQIKTLEDICGPLVPVRDLIKKVQQTQTVGEGDNAMEKTYTVNKLAD